MHASKQNTHQNSSPIGLKILDLIKYLIDFGGSLAPLVSVLEAFIPLISLGSILPTQYNIYTKINRCATYFTAPYINIKNNNEQLRCSKIISTYSLKYKKERIEFIECLQIPWSRLRR